MLTRTTKIVEKRLKSINLIKRKSNRTSLDIHNCIL
jgi:hypothetical protein